MVRETVRVPPAFPRRERPHPGPRLRAELHPAARLRAAAHRLISAIRSRAARVVVPSRHRDNKEQTVHIYIIIPSQFYHNFHLY